MFSYLSRSVKTTAFFLLTTYSISSTYATETVVKGVISNFDGKKIKVGIYADYLTFDIRWLDESTISDGKFQLKFDLETTEQILLKTEDKTTTLFTERGEVYNLNLNYDLAANQGQAFNKLLDISFPFPKNNGINQQIKLFNTDYQDFFAKNYQRFVIKAAGKEIEDFVKKWESRLGNFSSPFVKTYIKYSLANLEDINNASRTKLYNKYFRNQKIHYRNKEYMNFFKQFYQKDFEQLSLTKNGSMLLKSLMIDNDLQQSIELIQKFKEIEKAELAELYLIHGLYEVYYDKTVEQESVITMLTNIGKNGKNSSNREIAQSVKINLKKYDKDALAPEFSLLNVDSKLINLSQFKGQFVYLNFWADWSIPSLRELRVIKSLHEKYGEKIAFVSINLDESSEIYKATATKNSYDWNFLYFGNDYEIKDKYDVRTVPSYFLIDKDGKFLNRFAPNPAEIEKRLFELSQE